MFILTLMSILFIGAYSDKQSDIYPNCDLFSVTYIVPRNMRNGLLNVDFAWDRNNENYAKINGPVQHYLVRHGPLVEEGELSNKSHVIIAMKGERDEFKLQNVKPAGKYGIQVCAITANSTVDEDIWEHAWTGQYNLSNPIYQNGRRQRFDHNDYLAECNFIEKSHIRPINNRTNHSLTLYFSWENKQSSYQNLTSIDHYRVRYGRQESWGMPILDKNAQYVEAKNVSDGNPIVLSGIQYDSFYGIQICAMKSDKNEPIDWSRKAWLGSMETDWMIHGKKKK